MDTETDNFVKKCFENDCLRTYGRLLTGDYKHWCQDWDDLPIDETCQEFDCCACDREKIVGRYK